MGFEESLHLYRFDRNNPFCYKDPDDRFEIFVVPVLEFTFGLALGPLVVPTLGAIAAASVVYYSYQLFDHVCNEIDIEMQINNEKRKEKKKKSSNVYAPNRPLPLDDKHCRPIPDSNAKGQNTQLGTKNGSKGKYTQAREFDVNGKPVKDIDFTDHGYPQNHPNPHQHSWIENQTGGTLKRDDAKPLEEWIY